jgi:hypothetical protein
MKKLYLLKDRRILILWILIMNSTIPNAMVVLPVLLLRWEIFREVLVLHKISMISTSSSILLQFASKWNNGKKPLNFIRKVVWLKKQPVSIFRSKCSQLQHHLWIRSLHHLFWSWLQKQKKVRIIIRRQNLLTKEPMIGKI